MVDLVAAGIINRPWVTRSALQNAASITKTSSAPEQSSPVPEKEGAGGGRVISNMSG